jgi:hypothetical protein
MSNSVTSSPAGSSASNASNGELNIVVTMQPQEANGAGGNGFLNSLIPEPLDYTSFGATSYSSMLSALATYGLTGEEAEQAASGYLKTLDFPVFALPIILADAVKGYGEDGTWGAIQSATGDIAGYLTTAGIADTTLATSLTGALEFVGLTGLGATAGGIAAATIIAIGAGYVVDKVVDAGLQYIATFDGQPNSTNGVLEYPNGMSVSTLADGSTQYTFGNGLVFTQAADGSGTATLNGDIYSYDASSNLLGATFSDGLSVGFSASGASATVTDTSGASTSLSLSSNADGGTTVYFSGTDTSTSITVGVNADGQMTATANDNQYDFTMTTDSAGDQNLTTQDVTTGQTNSQSAFANGSPTSETVTNPDGSITQYTVNADGSESAITLNSSGQETESGQISPDGSSTVSFYNPSTGALTGENLVNADGSQTDYTINSDGSQAATVLNADGQTTETAVFNTNGSSTQTFYDPSTGALTGENLVNADGSQTDYTINSDGSQNATVLNADGQTTETAVFNADGSSTQMFYDPSTGTLTGENVGGADGSQTD